MVETALRVAHRALGKDADFETGGIRWEVGCLQPQEPLNGGGGRSNHKFPRRGSKLGRALGASVQASTHRHQM